MSRFIQLFRGLCPHPLKAIAFKIPFIISHGVKGVSPLTGLGGAHVLLVLLPAALVLFAASANATPAGCVVVSELCTIGAAERTIQGFRIERDCWEKQVVYACPNARPSGACRAISNDPECTQTGAECTRREPGGVCITEVSSFRCSIPKSGSGISLEDIIATAPERDVRTPLHCGSTLYCPDGLCDDLSEDEASPDFGKAAAWMGLLSRMGIEKDPDAVTLFRGDGQKCAKWPLGAKNCCSDKGWVLDYFGCSTSEKTLAEKRAAKRTHYVGSYCSTKSWFGCLTKKKSYCTFRSLFARVFQQQARAQLGISWGSAENPICRSLSIEEIQRVDFGRIDLSEIYGDMLNKANVPSPAATNSQIKSRIENYYRSKP